MNEGMIVAGTQCVGMVLSFTLLLRVRRLSVGIWSKDPSSERVFTGSRAEIVVGFERTFRAQERQI